MNEPASPGSTLPTGLVYGDVPNRIIAYIIDAIVLFAFNLAAGIVLGIVGLSVVTVSGLEVSTNYVASIIVAAVGLVISGVYFVYTWTTQRATVGMKVLNLQIGSAPSGTTITRDQAIRRWIALGAPFSVAQVLNPLPLIGLLIGLAALGWVIFLLYTTAQSPTKQGWHDVFANTMIVKAARSVA